MISCIFLGIVEVERVSIFLSLDFRDFQIESVQKIRTQFYRTLQIFIFLQRNVTNR
jgi:hypothetical protein